MKKYSLVLFVFTCFGKFFAMNPAPACGDGVVGKFFEEVRNYDAAPIGCFCGNRLAKEEKKYTDLTREMETPWDTQDTPGGEGVEDITVLKKIHHFSDKPSHKILVVWESKVFDYEYFFKSMFVYVFSEDKEKSGNLSRHFFAELKNRDNDESCFCEFIFLPANYVHLCEFFQNKVDMVIDCFDFHCSGKYSKFYEVCRYYNSLINLFIKGKSKKTHVLVGGLFIPEEFNASQQLPLIKEIRPDLLREECSFVKPETVDFGMRLRMVEKLQTL